MQAALCIMLRASSSRGLLVAIGQIFEHQPDGLHRVGIGVGRGVNRNRRFQRVSQAIDAGVGGKAFRHRHHELRIDNGDVGRERIVGERDFAAALLVGHHRKGSDFAARAAGSGNRDQARMVDLFRRILHHAFANIEEGAASSSRSASGDSYFSFMILAASITEPPPSAMIWSAL